jgi:hypothetical protein
LSGFDDHIPSLSSPADGSGLVGPMLKFRRASRNSENFRFIGCLGLVALLAHAPNVRAGTLASYHQTHQTIAQINQTIAKYGGDKP